MAQKRPNAAQEPDLGSQHAAGRCADARQAPTTGETFSSPSLSSRPGPRSHAVLFALAGPEQGAVFPLHRSVILVGRGARSNIALHDDAVSLRHARITRRDGGIHVQDDGSRNGTYVNDERVETPRLLEDGDHVTIGNTILKFSMLDELEEHALTQLFELTIRDPLTRAYNRRYLTAHLQSELAFSARRDLPLALLMVDIDHFKHINDTYGHGLGDVVLQLVAASIQRLLRPYDALCRYGGEEFVVVARDSSSRNAEILAERIRRHIEALSFDVPGGRARVTVSIGVVSWSAQAGADVGALIQAADEALYEAKNAGRNRVRSSAARSSPTLAPRPGGPHTIPPAPR
jgi:two-component system cell cycle response regulator